MQGREEEGDSVATFPVHGTNQRMESVAVSAGEGNYTFKDMLLYL